MFKATEKQFCVLISIWVSCVRVIVLLYDYLYVYKTFSFALSTVFLQFVKNKEKNLLTRYLYNVPFTMQQSLTRNTGLPLQKYTRAHILKN